MNPPQTRPFSGRRFWRWYTLAWVYLAGLYCAVFLIVGTSTVLRAVVGSVVYVIPMGALGVGALAVFRRLDWTAERRARLIAMHVALGVVFGVGVTLSNFGTFTILHRLAPATFPAPRLNLEYATWESLMGLLIYGVLAAVCFAILLQQRVREQEARAARAMALQTEAELRALRAQLNPHFLFNTLHSLLALVRHDPGAAEEALEQFGDLLRYTLDTQKNGEVVPLGEELSFVRNYLALESLRLGERLRLELDVDESLGDRWVPAFCLQPLVENAVRHAIAPRAAGGRLALRVRSEGAVVLLEVADDGPGAAADGPTQGNGLGLRLVRERLAARYGPGATLELVSAPGRGFRATIRIPREGGGA
jgi:sensor histidine kinase YesM